jgi:PAS domain-containing protein
MVTGSGLVRSGTLPLIGALVGRFSDISRQARCDGELLRNVLDEARGTEEVLKESDERFRDLYETAPHAYFAVSLEGRIH